jgi:ADP-dependent NAD(P)H-hydrate dehydratase / NAD(P)H-hydrate epimerase
MKLVTVSEMRAIEGEADANGLSYQAMMENAGHNLSREILKLSYAEGDEEDIQVLGLVGPGNNGGDTLIALTHLAQKGWKARAYLVKRKVAGDELIKRLEEADGEIYQADKDIDFMQLGTFIETADVVVDGVLGTGFKLPLKADVAKILGEIKSDLKALDWPPLVIAVDCPSGIDCDTGNIAQESILADATITMAAIKQGLLKLPAFDNIGELRVVNIGSLEKLKTWRVLNNEVADEAMARELQPKRPSDSHKGTFGKAMIAGGSINYTGATLLAGKAAYRIGAGLVSLAIPSPLHMTLAGELWEATWVLLPHEQGVISSSAADVLIANLDQVSALLIGPGLGLEDTTRDFVSNLVNGSMTNSAHGRIGFVRSVPDSKAKSKSNALPPLIIDADGLKLLAKLENWAKFIPDLSILTPHPGEMAILTGHTINEIQQDRLAFASNYSKEWGHIVVLKGAFTVIASPDGCTTTIPVATPALAHAGTGDVLAGIITGLRAQGVNAYDSARLGAWIHAQAGLIAAEVQGSTNAVLASDVLDAISDVLASLS